MGTGPIPSSKKALELAGWEIKDVDLFEINEAFAAQAIACVEELKLDHDRVNVCGGSLAIGHPLGASGARISTTLIHAMRDRQVHLGLATMWIGLGQGIAGVFELIE